MNIVLHVWRQKSRSEQGKLVRYPLENVSDHASFLEMLDVLNEKLTSNNEEPVAFDSDCREGICGMCSLVINGVPHGPDSGTTTCQLHMRRFKDGDEITIEPWRAKAFPVIRDLVVDRGSFDRIIQAGGFITVNSGGPKDANNILVPKAVSDKAMDAAQCIACGACVAACKNASAMLFVAAKVSHLNMLPQGQPEKEARVLNMVKQMDKEGFGNCTNQFECEAVCPKEIGVDFIARMNRDYLKANLVSQK
ncbi:MAG: succinate dehydrogenase/fumarate reductase iron-sulfur subunit [Oligoflexales bacterium]